MTMRVEQSPENSPTGPNVPNISALSQAPSLDDAVFGVERTGEVLDSLCESLAQCYRIARERAHQLQVIEGKPCAERQDEVCQKEKSQEENSL